MRKLMLVCSLCVFLFGACGSDDNLSNEDPNKGVDKVVVSVTPAETAKETDAPADAKDCTLVAYQIPLVDTPKPIIEGLEKEGDTFKTPENMREPEKNKEVVFDGRTYQCILDDYMPLVGDARFPMFSHQYYAIDDEIGRVMISCDSVTGKVNGFGAFESTLVEKNVEPAFSYEEGKKKAAEIAKSYVSNFDDYTFVEGPSSGDTGRAYMYEYCYYLGDIKTYESYAIHFNYDGDVILLSCNADGAFVGMKDKDAFIEKFSEENIVKAVAQWADKDVSEIKVSDLSIWVLYDGTVGVKCYVKDMEGFDNGVELFLMDKE